MTKRQLYKTTTFQNSHFKFFGTLLKLYFLKKKEIVMKKRNQTTSMISPLNEDKNYSILVRNQIQNFHEYLPEMNKK